MADDDPAYVAWLRKGACALRAPGVRCEGPLQVHHHTGEGMSLRASDARAFPLCRHHHSSFHAAAGIFKEWDKLKRRLWQDTMVQFYRNRYEDKDVF